MRQRLTAIVALCLGMAALAGASTGSARVAAESGQASLLIGWANPLASNPGLQAITYGQVQAAKKLNWRVRTIDSNLFDGQAGLRRRHAHQPGIEGADQLDAQSRRPRCGLPACPQGEHPGRHLRDAVEVLEHDRLPPAVLALHARRRRGEVHRREDSRREGAGRRPGPGAGSAPLYGVLREAGKGPRVEGARAPGQRQGHGGRRAAAGRQHADEAPRHAGDLGVQRSERARRRRDRSRTRRQGLVGQPEGRHRDRARSAPRKRPMRSRHAV